MDDENVIEQVEATTTNKINEPTNRISHSDDPRPSWVLKLEAQTKQIPNAFAL